VQAIERTFMLAPSAAGAHDVQHPLRLLVGGVFVCVCGRSGMISLDGAGDVSVYTTVNSFASGDLVICLQDETYYLHS
jgi:hypothetical protein